MTRPPPSNPLRALPQREVTPEMRKRTARTFWLILLAFVTGIGVMVATLAWQGRTARDYAQAVRSAVVAANPSPNVGYTVACDQVRPGPLPRGVESCEVSVAGGEVSVKLAFQGGREFTLSR